MKTIRWEITSKCNLSCEHCIVGKIHREDISLVKAKEIVDFLVQKGVKEISFTTKEPFMFEGFIDLLEYCTINNLYFSIITNGTLLNEEIINKLYSLNLKYICISLDGWIEEDNDRIRGKGTFEKIEQTLSIFKYYNNVNLKYIPVYIQTLITKNNINNIDKLVEFYNKYPDFILSLGLIIEYGNAKKKKELIIDNLNEFKESLINEIKKVKGKVYFKDSGYYETIFDNFIFGLNSKPHFPHCSIDNDYFTILSDGRLCKCMLLLEKNINPKFKVIYSDIKSPNNKDTTDYNLIKNEYKNNSICNNCTISEQCNLCYLIQENDKMLNNQLKNCEKYKNKIDRLVEEIVDGKLKIGINNYSVLFNNYLYVFYNDYKFEKIQLNELELNAIYQIMNDSFEKFVSMYQMNIVKEVINFFLCKNVIINKDYDGEYGNGRLSSNN